MTEWINQNPGLALVGVSAVIFFIADAWWKVGVQNRLKELERKQGKTIP